MSRFLSEKFSALTPYVPGEQPRDKKYIKLNTNESPYPPSDAVMRALNSKEVNSLRLYPDPECTSLKEKMARYMMNAMLSAWSPSIARTRSTIPISHSLS